MSTIVQRVMGFLIFGAVLAAAIAGFLMWQAASTARENSREGWPDDTPLARALAEFSHRHEALEGLHPVLASSTIYIGAGGNCPGNYLDTNNQRYSFVVDRYEDGTLYYAFDTLERLTEWTRSRRSRPCYLEATGAGFADMLTNQDDPSYLRMNEAGPGYVTLSPADLESVAALGG